MTEIQWLDILIDHRDNSMLWVCKVHPLLPFKLFVSSTFGCDCKDKNKGISFILPHFVNGFCCKLYEYVRGS